MPLQHIQDVALLLPTWWMFRGPRHCISWGHKPPLREKAILEQSPLDLQLAQLGQFLNVSNTHRLAEDAAKPLEHIPHKTCRMPQKIPSASSSLRVL